MTPQPLRLLAIALFLLAVTSAGLSAEETGNLLADQWVPLPLEAAEPVPVFQEPVAAETVFHNTESVPPLPAEPVSPELNLDSPPVAIDEEDTPLVEDAFGRPYNADGWYSHPEVSETTWRSGADGRFGEFSFGGTSAMSISDWQGLSTLFGYRFHFLDGPSLSDMPPRLFDFNFGLHFFHEVLEGAWFDMGFAAGIYSDFEDSAREGWRFPAHAAFSWALVPEVQPVVGVRYYDREELGLLPLVGVILKPEDGFRAELLFPEPKIAIRAYEGEEAEHWISLSGRIGGGEWAIEREPSGRADVVTYNDYQLILGFETAVESFAVSALEIGYSFERELLYRSGAGNFEPSETIFVRLVTRR